MVPEFLKRLEAHGTLERAAWDKNYHKSKRDHFGTPAPIARKLVQEFIKPLSNEERLIFAQNLWKTNHFDAMMAATKVCEKIKPGPALWQTLLTFLPDIDGWGLEDGLCHATWNCIAHNETLLDTLETWTKHPNFWIRRAALVYTLPYAKPGQNPERMLSWAATYTPDPEWFIQKSIGWWLRPLAPHNPSRVLEFLTDHPLKGVALREATRKLPSQHSTVKFLTQLPF
ncbi:MAG: DNA alkylation repair protein [Simkaniaceae bacterium]|nr:DNA alkylation repair protein [Simkaniaceae bacterium]